MTKFHCQLFIALLGMYFWFLVGIGRTDTEALCTIMSLIIQYFSLASLFWMGAEALLMFKKLIIVFGSISLKFVIAVSLICWCKLNTFKNKLCTIMKYYVLSEPVIYNSVICIILTRHQHSNIKITPVTSREINTFSIHLNAVN